MPTKKDLDAVKADLATVQDKAFEMARNAIEKEYGKGSVQQFNDTDKPQGIERFSSGCFSLDLALGGGYPKGRIIEILGPESSGKTTLALMAIAQAQKVDPRRGYYIDVEHALDPGYAEALDVNLDRMAISQPDTGEQALNIMLHMLRSGSVSVIVVDSVAALVPQKELEGDIGDQSMGVQARLMSQTLRMITGIAAKSNTTVIFINQIRMKIGVMFGNPETTSGGNALKFYASVRLDVRAGEKQKDGSDETDITGRMTKVKVIKNKTYPPFKTAEFPITFGVGVDWAGDLVQTAMNKKVLDKDGAWIKWNGELVGHGFDKTCEYFKSNPEKANLLMETLRQPS